VEGSVRLFRKRSKVGVVRQADSADTIHLTAFAQSHTGVVAFVEPPTAVSTTPVVLGPHRGVGPRRGARDARTAHELANRLGVPSYDAALVGYPQRMRDWNARAKAAGRGPGPGSATGPTGDAPA
jgi:hypothetical protein